MVVTGTDDPTADLVEAELARRGVGHVRCDLSDFPQRLILAAQLDDHGQWTGEIRHGDGWRVALETVRTVYYRRPTDFTPAPDLGRSARRFVTAESRAGFGGVLATLRARFVNHPFRIADAEFKPLQLSTAIDCGLTVPSTAVTNDGDHARRFGSAQRTGIVYKPLGGGFVRDDNGDLQLIYATRTHVEDNDTGSVAASVHTFQAWIDKAYDVRVTAAGHNQFGAAIYANSEESRVDWRSDYSALSYAPIKIPNSIRDSITSYLARFGLLFGAFDFTVDRCGKWWFLECNPNGQWGFIADATDLPITSAIADLLVGDAT